jgi:hypothetical protein
LQNISSTGTIVSYNDQGKREIYYRFIWILGGYRVLRGKQKIIIQIHRYIRFQITVPIYKEYPDLYNENINLFEIGTLGLRSIGSSIAPTLRPQDPIRLKQEILNKGAFAIIRYYWDISTGLEYIYKEPLNKRRFEKGVWEKETDIIKQISYIS